MLDELEYAGYNNYWKVLNAKDFNVPQNRERVFIVSIRKDIDIGFSFPEPIECNKRLKDIIEETVDEKYFIDNEKTEKLLKQLNYEQADKLGIDLTINMPKFKDYANCVKARYDAGVSNQKSDGTGVCVPCITPDRINKRQNGRRFKEDGDPMFTLTSQDRHGILQIGNIVNTGNFSNPQRGRIYSPEGISPTLNTVGGGGLEPKIIQQKHTKLPCILDDRDKGYGMKTSDICPTQRAERSGIKCIQQDFRVRKLTPLECWRLMGFDDEDYWGARKTLEKEFYSGRDRSNSRMYKWQEIL